MTLELNNEKRLTLAEVLIDALNENTDNIKWKKGKYETAEEEEKTTIRFEIDRLLQERATMSELLAELTGEDK